MLQYKTFGIGNTEQEARRDFEQNAAWSRKTNTNGIVIIPGTEGFTESQGRILMCAAYTVTRPIVEGIGLNQSQAIHDFYDNAAFMSGVTVDAICMEPRSGDFTKLGPCLVFRAAYAISNYATLCNTVEREVN